MLRVHTQEDEAETPMVMPDTGPPFIPVRTKPHPKPCLLVFGELYKNGFSSFWGEFQSQSESLFSLVCLMRPPTNPDTQGTQGTDPSLEVKPLH